MGCSKATSPEGIISDNIERMEVGIEEKKSGDVIELLHRNFGTKSGHDTQWVKQLLAIYMFKHQNIGIVISGLEITVDSTNAKAQFTALVTGGEGLIPRQGALYDLDTDWRLEDGEWHLVYAHWEPH